MSRYLDDNTVDMLKTLQDADDPNFLADLISLFSLRTPETIALLNQYYKEKNFKTLQSVAHGLKGSCMQIGATAMQNYAALIEKMPTESIEKEVPDLIENLKQVFPETVTELRSELGL